MVLYLDIILFLNFIVNYCFMKLIYILFNEKINVKRLVISSIISVIFLFSFLIDYYVYSIIKMIGGIVLVLIAFKFSSKSRYIFMCSMYYILQYAFIGVLTVFNVKGLLCLVFLLLICLLVLIYSRRSHILKDKSYKIIIELNNKTFLIDGFLDTGNIACYYELPIVFLDYKYYDESLTVNNEMKINTVNGEGLIKCYKPKHFYVIENNQKIDKEVLIAFNHFDNEISCLLNYLIFI